ncbi:threonine synthase [Treponema pedis]|uniref:Threonine synthase n=1 Tax=Treponema pedis TaxID=409322 RepID=A0A7S6WRN3_9SPIR|nr:threonine synthase [Treponema pedis]QOW62040.1 threonine synthase [Treponema pedis]
MFFYDINDKSIQVSFKRAVIEGFNADTGGVFMPSQIDKLSPSMIYRNPPPSFRDIVFEVAKMFCGSEIPDNDLMSVIAQFYPYKIPITPIAQTTYILELFHGATCNYKDISAGFSAYLLEYFNAAEKTPVNLLAAASGERACAISAAVSKVKGVNAVILYPKNSLTEIQERQLACSPKNVYCFSVEGRLEDCEAIVNKALCDIKVKKRFKLIPSGALNSASLIPKIAFFIYSSLAVLYRCGYDNKIEKPEIIASVPSGSFSALTAGLIAKKMGAPISGFICAENINHCLTDLLISGGFNSKAKIKTNTPELDESNLINFKRMTALYDIEDLKKLIIPYCFDDETTIEAVTHCNDKTGYIIDPYGGMAWKAWIDIYHGALNSVRLKSVDDDFQAGVPAQYGSVFTGGIKTWFHSSSKTNLIGLILQTSHPAKFTEIMKTAVGRPPSLPDRLESLPFTESKAVNIKASYSDFKKHLFDIIEE